MTKIENIEVPAKLHAMLEGMSMVCNMYVDEVLIECAYENMAALLLRRSDKVPDWVVLGILEEYDLWRREVNGG